MEKGIEVPSSPSTSEMDWQSISPLSIEQRADESVRDGKIDLNEKFRISPASYLKEQIRFLLSGEEREDTLVRVMRLLENSKIHRNAIVHGKSSSSLRLMCAQDCIKYCKSEGDILRDDISEGRKLHHLPHLKEADIPFDMPGAFPRDIRKGKSAVNSTVQVPITSLGDSNLALFTSPVDLSVRDSTHSNQNDTDEYDKDQYNDNTSNNTTITNYTDNRDIVANNKKSNNTNTNTNNHDGVYDNASGTNEIVKLDMAPGRNGRRLAVSAAPFTPVSLEEFRPRVIQKPMSEREPLLKCVQNCSIFRHMDSVVQDLVVKALKREVFSAGATILEQGKESNETFYLIFKGTCETVKNGKSMAILKPGDTFGDLEIMYKQELCTTSVRCVTRCALYTMDAHTYRGIVHHVYTRRRQKYRGLVGNVPFLSSVSEEDQDRIIEALEQKEYRRGETVIRFGERGRYMHIILKGEVQVIGRNLGERTEIVRLKEGDVFGELEFLFDHLTVADVVVTSHRLVTARIARGHFEMICGPIQDRLKDFVASSPAYAKYCGEEPTKKTTNSTINHRDSFHEPQDDFPDGSFHFKDLNRDGEILLSPSTWQHWTFSQDEALSKSLHNRDSSVSKVEFFSPTDSRSVVPFFRFPFESLNILDMAILCVREDGDILNWNVTMERVTGYKAEDVLGHSIYTFLLKTTDQQQMLQAIERAKSYFGAVDVYLEEMKDSNESKYAFSRSDGLTSTILNFMIIPPLVASDTHSPQMFLLIGSEEKEVQQKSQDQTNWLSTQIRAVLEDGSLTFETRLHLIADIINNFELVYRSITFARENCRVVDIRKLMGQVMMDLASPCIEKGISVKQRFDNLKCDRAYLDTALLPDCLRCAMCVCIDASNQDSTVTVTTTTIQRQGVDFLLINYHLAGSIIPDSILSIFREVSDPQVDSTVIKDEKSDLAGAGGGSSWLLPTSIGNDIDHPTISEEYLDHLCHLKDATESQGGKIKVQVDMEGSNMVIIVPFMPAENITGALQKEPTIETAPNTAERGSGDKVTPIIEPSKKLPLLRPLVLQEEKLITDSPLIGPIPPDTGTLDDHVSDEIGARSTSLSFVKRYNYTTLLVEETPAHRNMLCAYLWERKHAVLPAYDAADLNRLSQVADIMFIDPQQSILSDPITLLREKAHHMAVVITGKNLTEKNIKAYETAGFITLKKPCTSTQAFHAIRRAEEKIFKFKEEAERIAQTRETLSRNSRGAWKKGQMLGKGAFSTVYEAIDVLTGGKMAVKEIRMEENNTAHLEQFVGEIATMCNLQHPNIIHYFYCEESKEENVSRVFMEFAAGGTLQKLLAKKGKLEFKEYQSLLQNIVEGIAYIHSQHYVHGDIKTANVLLSEDGTGKIGDFGTARTVRDGQLLYDMQGSPLYMSPECMSAGEIEDGVKIGYSFPTDIWSLGCVALEMATNKPPFEHVKKARGPAGLTSYITSLTDIPDLSPLFESPPSIIEFVSACLNPDPSKRATAQELLHFTIFNEASDEDLKSALKALKRAQLLHVLNRFVAFKEPKPTKDSSPGKKIRKKNHKDPNAADMFYASDAASRTQYSTSYGSNSTSENDSDDSSSTSGVSFNSNTARYGFRRKGKDSATKRGEKKQQKRRSGIQGFKSTPGETSPSGKTNGNDKPNPDTQSGIHFVEGNEDTESAFFATSSSSSPSLVPPREEESHSFPTQVGGSLEKSKNTLFRVMSSRIPQHLLHPMPAKPSPASVTHSTATVGDSKIVASKSNSFFGHNFTKTVSLFGTNLDEALHGAANEFLNNLTGGAARSTSFVRDLLIHSDSGVRSPQLSRVIARDTDTEAQGHQNDQLEKSISLKSNPLKPTPLSSYALKPRKETDIFAQSQRRPSITVKPKTVFVVEDFLPPVSSGVSVATPKVFADPIDLGSKGKPTRRAAIVAPAPLAFRADTSLTSLITLEGNLQKKSQERCAANFTEDSAVTSDKNLGTLETDSKLESDKIADFPKYSSLNGAGPRSPWPGFQRVGFKNIFSEHPLCVSGNETVSQTNFSFDSDCLNNPNKGGGAPVYVDPLLPVDMSKVDDTPGGEASGWQGKVGNLLRETLQVVSTLQKPQGSTGGEKNKDPLPVSPHRHGLKLMVDGSRVDSKGRDLIQHLIDELKNAIKT